MKRIQIQGEDTLYFITQDGQVFSEKTKKFLQGDISSGYKRVLLCLNNGERIRKPVHVLVAQTYIPNPNNLPIVHHIDGNRLNNKVENLQWISYSDNSKEKKNTFNKIKNIFTEQELNHEQWRNFRNSPYIVSNLGRLKNLKTGKIKEGHIHPILGYIRDTLNLKEGEVTFPRHRIIYEAFHPQEEINVINHKNGIRYDNRLENLENVSYSENLKKAYVETKTRRTRKCVLYHNEKDFKVFFSIVEASKYFNCNESQIRLAMDRGKMYKDYKIKELSNEEYNKYLVEGSETIESIIKEKDLNE